MGDDVGLGLPAHGGVGPADQGEVVGQLKVLQHLDGGDLGLGSGHIQGETLCLQPGQQVRHHLRLDPQKDVVAGLGDGFIVGDGGPQLLGQSLCLLRGAVGQQQLRRGGGLGGGMGQCAPHIAGADKADFHNVIPPCGNCGASAP